GQDVRDLRRTAVTGKCAGPGPQAGYAVGWWVDRLAGVARRPGVSAAAGREPGQAGHPLEGQRDADGVTRGAAPGSGRCEARRHRYTDGPVQHARRLATAQRPSPRELIWGLGVGGWELGTTDSLAPSP